MNYGYAYHSLRFIHENKRKPKIYKHQNSMDAPNVARSVLMAYFNPPIELLCDANAEHLGWHVIHRNETGNHVP